MLPNPLEFVASLNIFSTRPYTLKISRYAPCPFRDDFEEIWKNSKMR